MSNSAQVTVGICRIPQTNAPLASASAILMARSSTSLRYRAMKQEERAALRYLSKLGDEPPVFEPNGNVPPDFVLGRSTAIEVRRLNQHDFRGQKPVGLDDTAYPLVGTLERVLSTYSPPVDGRSYWVFLEFERPFKRGRLAARGMKSALDDFLASGSPAPVVLSAGVNMELYLHPRSPPTARRFSLGGMSDDDGDGCVVPSYAENIRHCISEKARKVEPHRGLYQSWWLVLVDAMGWSLDPHEVEALRALVADLKGFERVIVIDFTGEAVHIEWDHPSIRG